ncbi:MAG TPA: histidine phosphatase family protein [Microvirga sp.]|jgi:probable phosphoglycerate mutase|nr:histidine phosphatase family protein [Microvirga sp.]
MMGLPTLYLLRHGETRWNREGRLQGHLDSPLTEKGGAQAALMGAILRDELGWAPAYRLVSSPLGRAQATAAAVAASLGLAIETDARLAEIDVGAWSGFTRAEAERDWPEHFQSATELDWFFYAPEGERYGDVRHRMEDWLAALHEPTIAVAHGLCGKVLRGVYAGLSERETLQLLEPQDAVFRLRDGTITALRHAHTG